MTFRTERRTVDLSAYPDLVVIYLGMRVNGERAKQMLQGLGPQIGDSVKAKPDGLLLHEDLTTWSWRPGFSSSRLSSSREEPCFQLAGAQAAGPATEPPPVLSEEQLYTA